MSKQGVTGPVTRQTCWRCGWRDCKCMSSWWALSACLAFVPAGCVPKPGPDPLEPPGPVQEACASFCDLLDRGHCPGASGSPGQDEQRGTVDDVPCVQVCHSLQSKDTYRADTDCLSNATSCQAAEVCMFGE